MNNDFKDDGLEELFNEVFRIPTREEFIEKFIKPKTVENIELSKEHEDREFMNYMIRKTSNILEDTFDIKNTINLNSIIYRDFLNEERKKEILQYKMYGLTSPQIYNLIYIYLRYDYAGRMSKDKIVRMLLEDVDYAKNQMQIILKLKYTPQQYQDFKQRNNR